MQLTTTRGSENCRMTLYMGARVTGTNVDNQSMGGVQCRHAADGCLASRTAYCTTVSVLDRTS